MSTNHYEMLGVTSDATPSEIKSAYRKLSKKYHPDVNDADNANVVFRMIEEAHRTLYDENTRKQYDFSLNPKASFSSEAPKTNEDSAPPRQPHEGDNHRSQKRDKTTAHKHMHPEFESGWQSDFAISLLYYSARILTFPFIVLLKFVEVTALFLTGIATLAGGILFLLGIIIGITMFFTPGFKLAFVITPIVFCFGGIALPYIVGIVPAALGTVREAIYDFVTMIKPY